MFTPVTPITMNIPLSETTYSTTDYEMFKTPALLFKNNVLQKALDESRVTVNKTVLYRYGQVVPNDYPYRVLGSVIDLRAWQISTRTYYANSWNDPSAINVRKGGLSQGTMVYMPGRDNGQIGSTDMEGSFTTNQNTANKKYLFLETVFSGVKTGQYQNIISASGSIIVANNWPTVGRETHHIQLPISTWDAKTINMQLLPNESYLNITVYPDLTSSGLAYYNTEVIKDTVQSIPTTLNNQTNQVQSILNNKATQVIYVSKDNKSSLTQLGIPLTAVNGGVYLTNGGVRVQVIFYDKPSNLEQLNLS